VKGWWYKGRQVSAFPGELLSLQDRTISSLPIQGRHRTSLPHPNIRVHTSSAPLHLILQLPVMPVNYVPSQDDRTKQTTPLLYTQSPLRLLWWDIKWCALHLYTTPGIIFPLTYRSGPRDELYPSASNLFVIAFHIILIVAQLLFLATIPPSPLFFTVPLGLFLAWIAFFLIVNRLLCGILNGKKMVYHSDVDISQYESHPEEEWVFINGVSVGCVLVPRIMKKPY
jgi:hypothetical protein